VRSLALLVLGACASSYGRLERDVVLAAYTPLASNAEIARRALPPVTNRRIAETLAARKLAFGAQAIDLARERFDIYVPPGPPPPGGYGLLVFVAPWSTPTRPDVWRGPLDRHHLIFISAQRSGNGESLLDRRLPLALLAAHNARARFPIDDRRIYVAGFSGGSRVAEIAALAYPDVFRGAILDAGADPIDGRAGMYKPPADLFQRFQHARLVYITGEQDTGVQREDDLSLASMREACVLDVDVESARGLGHQPLDMASLDVALDALEAPPHVDPAELARCDARVDRELADAVGRITTAIERGDRKRARELIDAADARFAGLAGTRLLELDSRLASLPERQLE